MLLALGSALTFLNRMLIITLYLIYNFPLSTYAVIYKPLLYHF